MSEPTVTWALRWADEFNDGRCYRSAADDGSFSERAGSQRFATAEAARASYGFRTFGFNHGHSVCKDSGYKVVHVEWALRWYRGDVPGDYRSKFGGFNDQRSNAQRYSSAKAARAAVHSGVMHGAGGDQSGYKVVRLTRVIPARASFGFSAYTVVRIIRAVKP